MSYLFALIALAIATPASAELIFFSEQRSMSVASHRFEGDRIIVALRGGGEMSFDRALITKIAPDEVPLRRRCRGRDARTLFLPVRVSRRACGQDGLRSDHRERRDETRRRRAHRESGHPGRVGVSAARAFAEGRDGADAADAGERRGSTKRAIRTTPRATSKRARNTSSDSSTSSSFRWRWPPTTPARARCAVSAAFRRTPKPRRTSTKIAGTALGAIWN